MQIHEFIQHAVQRVRVHSCSTLYTACMHIYACRIKCIACCSSRSLVFQSDMYVQPQASALLCDCVLPSTHESTDVADVLQLASCRASKRPSMLHVLCRKVTVEKLHMSKQEAKLYEHAKHAALQQMQASHTLCLSAVKTALLCHCKHTHLF